MAEVRDRLQNNDDYLLLEQLELEQRQAARRRGKVISNQLTLFREA